MKQSGAISEPFWLRTTLLVVAIGYIAFLVLLPMAAVFAEAFRNGFAAYWEALQEPNARSAISLTLLVAAIAVPFNVVFGIAASWSIAKFDFVGKRLLITFIDLPFSVSPVISGLIYVLLFGAGSSLGQWLDEYDIQIIFAVPGLVIAVPTSVGYGVSHKGETALHSALASCASGVVVVNIDNGYGGACAALRALRV
jgi:sulfate transport system permease protein